MKTLKKIVPFLFTLLVCFCASGVFGQEASAAAHRVTLQLEKITVVPDNILNNLDMSGTASLVKTTAEQPANNRIFIERKNISVPSIEPTLLLSAKNIANKNTIICVLLITSTQE